MDIVNLKDFKMGFCIGCLSCQKTNRCVIKDDITKEMLNNICNSDVLVFVTPVYYYAVSGADYIDANNPAGKAIVQKSGKDKTAYTINMNLPISVVGV